MPAALEGCKVIDLTRQMAGPYCTQILSDFGAEVIKIESIERGDPCRVTGVDFYGDESALFLMWNHGKRSMAVDLHTKDGLDLVKSLVESADILVENFRPGVAEDIGLGYEILAEINSKLIYCSVSGFGPEGPLADLPATDPVIQAMSGVMSVTGATKDNPVLVGIPIADFTAALLCVQGALLGLLAREKTGQGQKIDISMLDGLVSALSTRLASYWATGVDPAPHGSCHSVVAPYQVFSTKDGIAMAGVWGGDGWSRFCEAIGHGELAQDPRFTSNSERVNRRDELVEIIKPVFREKTTEEWQEAFRRVGALFGPVLGFTELFSHPQIEYDQIVEEVEHSTLGIIPQLGSPVRMSKTPARIYSAPPILGEHTREVLEENGLSKEEIDGLEKRNVIRIA